MNGASGRPLNGAAGWGFKGRSAAFARLRGLPPPDRAMPRGLRSLLLAVALVPGPVLAQFVPVTGGAPALETFDTLAASGSGSGLPAGWAFVESGSNANTSYSASGGVANGGDTYSFGTGTSSERALGGIQSNSLVPLFGAQLRNDTGTTLLQLAVTYTGEQWRLGSTGRVDRLDFQYSLDATSLTTGTWTDVDALDFVAPVTAGTVGALDGNASANRSAIGATITGLSLAPAATLWVRWLDFNASGADDGLAIDDASFSSGAPPVDVAPRVASTVPADNATLVAVGANVAVTFSEPVALGATALELACTSGPRTLARSGGPTTWTFDPATDFAPGDACTGTVRAAQVTDLDGTPDAMAADVVFGFTVAPDLPPTVVSTVPANNATNVGLGANLVVAFSEPVNAGTGAFELRCGPSDPLAFGISQVAQTTYTLDPVANFEPLADCTLRVVAAQVADLDASADPLPADVLVAFTTGQGASDYYAGVDASSCQALRTTLHALIDDHTVYPYTGSPTDVWTMLEAADQDPADPARVLDVYFNKSFLKVTDRDTGTSVPQGTRYNREHTWPQSLGFPNATGNLGFPNAPRSDAHMLYASEKDWNADRGNKPFADCPPPGCSARYTLSHPITGGAGSAAACSYAAGNCNWVGGADGNQGSFEVWTRRKGDVARAVLYMDVRYEGGVATGGNTQGQAEPELIVTDDRNLIQQASGGTAYMGLRSTLLAWHALDPPDAQEVLRNDVVQSFQGNRNPFIDHPEWVALAFAQPCGSGPADAVFGNGFEP